ncbi:MAG TPA: DNA topoisomerase IB [Caulobacteraceae bacterium]|jgi:DNA topoisomerase-1
MASDALAENPVHAEQAGLSYVNDHDPGIRRLKAGKGFTYKDTEGRTVKDFATLDRIKSLVIPPAWTDVWICPDPDGHIQATGRDQRGRKQYKYHPRWRETRDETKYGRMAAFGRVLPRLRKRVEADLSLRGLPKEKVLAAIIRVMEMTLIRVGNDEYAKANKSYGLTTLRDKHVKFQGSSAVFEFTGKSGKTHRTGIRDRRLARIVKACQDIPGQRLFQYIDSEGQRHAVTSADVNAYIRQATRGPFTAKDFRTWAGTLYCAGRLVEAGAADSPTAAKRVIAACVKETAGQLGNTPAVCRSSYVHPKVFDHYTEGVLADGFRARGGDPEKALLKFLDRLAQEAEVTAQAA